MRLKARVDRRYLLLVPSLVLAGAGYALFGRPHFPDDHFSWISGFGSFLVFFWWAAGVLGWGRFWVRWLDWPIKSPWALWSGVAALGCVWASASVYAIGLVLGMGFAFRPVAWIWVLAGQILGLKLQKVSKGKSHEAGDSLERRLTTGLLVLLAVSAVFKLFEAARLQSMGDPLSAYLPGIRAWFDAGSFSAFKKNYMYFYSATWEALFQWGNLLLARGPGTALDAVQRFAQWTTCFFGYFGIAIASGTIFSRLVPESGDSRRSYVGVLAALAAVSTPAIRSHAILAKNDVGASFWAIAAMIPLIEPSIRGKSSLKPIFASGVLFGVALMGKIPYAMFILCVGMAWAFYIRFSPRPLLAMVAGGLAGSSWIVIRNLVLAHSPLFPFLTSGSAAQALLSSATIAQLRGAAGGGFPPSLPALRGYFWELLTHFWPIPLSLLSIFLVRSTTRKNPRTWLILGAWVAALGFMLFLRPRTEIRYNGPTLAFLAASGVWVVFECTRRFRSWSGAIAIVFAVALLVDSRLPLYVLFQFNQKKFEPTPAFLLGHTGGGAKEWIRSHTSPGDMAVSVGDPELYYVLHKGVQELTLDIPLWRQVETAGTDLARVRALLRNKRRYSYFWRPFQVYLGPTERSLVQFTERFPACRVFDDGQGLIVDLQCVSKSARSSRV